MVKRSLRREFSFSRFIEYLGIFGILRGEFLFYFLGSLSQGHRACEFSDVGVVLSQYSSKCHCIPLLSIDSGGELRIVQFQGMEVSKKVLLFEYSWVVMPRGGGSPQLNHPSCPVDDWVDFGQPGMS